MSQGWDEIGAVSDADLQLAQRLINSGMVSGMDDEVGDVDIVGDIDIVGAPMKQKLNAAVNNRARSMVSRALQRAQATGRPQATQASPQGDAKTRYLSCSRDATTGGGLIAAGADTDVIVEPQAPFRPTAYIVDDESGEDFLILDIKIGTESLMVNSGPIPASQFKGDSSLNEILQKTGQTSQQFTVRVRNRNTADARPFYSSFKGWSV